MGLYNKQASAQASALFYVACFFCICDWNNIYLSRAKTGDHICENETSSPTRYIGRGGVVRWHLHWKSDSLAHTYVSSSPNLICTKKMCNPATRLIGRLSSECDFFSVIYERIAWNENTYVSMKHPPYSLFCTWWRCRVIREKCAISHLHQKQMCYPATREVGRLSSEYETSSLLAILYLVEVTRDTCIEKVTP